MRTHTGLLALVLGVAVAGCTSGHPLAAKSAEAAATSSPARPSSPVASAQPPPIPTSTLSHTSPAARRPPPPVAVVGDTVRVVDRAHAGTSGSRSARVFLGLGRTYVLSILDDAAADGAAHPYGITRLSLATKPTSPVHLDLDGSLTDPVFGSGSVWLVRGIGARPEDFPRSLDLIRVDPTTLKVTGSVHVGVANDILAAANAVWIATTQSTLLRVDPATMKVTVARKLATPLQVLAYDGKHLWALQNPSDTGTNSRLEEFDPATMRRIVDIPLPWYSEQLAVSATRAFVILSGVPARVLAFEPATRRQLWSYTIETTTYTYAVLAAGGGGSVWYLAGPGRLGHLDAGGRPTGREVDVHRVDPYDITANPLGLKVIFPGGYLTLRP